MSCLVPISLNLIVPRSRTQVLHIKDIKHLASRWRMLRIPVLPPGLAGSVTLQFSPEACLSLC